MTANGSAQTLWRACGTTAGRTTCRRCLTDSLQPKLSRPIATHAVLQSASHRRGRSNPRAIGASRSLSSLLRPQKPGKEIAVLGGGLTGLTTAYYLTKFYPNAKITLYERDKRLGGWVDTEEVRVPSEGRDEKIYFERGPRTVAAQSNTPKYDDFVLWDLIDQLGLWSDTHIMPKDTGPSMSRYIYYPDRLVNVTAPAFNIRDLSSTVKGLTRLAGSVLTEPLFKGILPSLFHYLIVDPVYETREEGDVHLDDVSIGEFFGKKFRTPELINNLLSALIHGVYGGDVWKLSMEAGMFRRMLIADQVDVRPYRNAEMLMEAQDMFLALDVIGRNNALVHPARDSWNWGFIGFYNGFSTLTDRIADDLKKNPNVTIRTSDHITAIKFIERTQKVEIHSSKSKQPKQYSQVISTLFSGTLGNLTGDALPTLKKEEAVTIQVVNLWYPTPGLNAPNTGFGYLIPGSVPAENNPHAALGVLFDSDREALRGPPQDPRVLKAGRMDTMTGTKFTVMLGGHHWDWLPRDSWPDAQQAAEMAKDTVRRQLGIPESAEFGVVASTKVCRECIPQQYAGHRVRMRAAHEELLAAFRGKLTVAGGSYTPPGVLPSLRAGRDVAMHVAGHGYLNLPKERVEPLKHVGETGLEWATLGGYSLMPLMKKDVPFRYGNTTL